jgi:glycosyltransferase involved in cell wall biosynthesis
MRVDPRSLDVTVVSVARAIWGSERSILRLAWPLADRGVRLTIAAPDGPFLNAAREAGLNVLAFELPEHTGVVDAAPSIASSLGKAWREVPMVARGVRALGDATAGADVVHSNSLLANMDCALAGRRYGRPTVLEIHDLVRPGISRHLLSVALGLADAGVAISNPVAENVSEVVRAKMHLIPQGIDLTRFHPGAGDPSVRAEFTARPDEPLVAMIGRVDPAKGVHRAVAAVAELNAHGTRCSLVVVGSPSVGNEEYARAVRAEAAATAGYRVRFVGTVGDVRDVLRSADVVVNASDAEPFGLSVLEAQACGVPVVVPDTGGLRDFVSEGITGRVFALADPSSLAATLAEMARSPAEHAAMAQTALVQTRARYSLEARADALTGLYRGLVARAPAAGALAEAV